MVTKPEVRIQYGRLLDPFFLFYCKNNPDLKKLGWNDWTPPSKEELNKRINAYKEEWAKHNVTEEIARVLNLSFVHNALEVFIVSGTPRGMSHPLILKSGYKPKEFVAALAHELIHLILTENKIPRVVYDINASESTNNHVIVYAVLKKVLNAELWDYEVKAAKQGDYRKALDLSEQIGPDEVIKMMVKKPLSLENL